MNNDNLPPGCTLREINERFGPPRCEGCKKVIPDEADDPRPCDHGFCQDCTEIYRSLRDERKDNR